MYDFSFTDEEIEQIEAWLEEQEKIMMEHQKATITKDDPNYMWYQISWEGGYAYTGAIGADHSFVFTPTSIGTLRSVQHSGTGNQLHFNDNL